MNSFGNTQGLRQKGPAVRDQCSFLNNSISISNIQLKSSAEKQQICPATKSRCVYVNNPNGFWKNKKTFVNFRQCTQQPYTRHNGYLDTLLIFGDSLGRNFYNSINKSSMCKTLFKKCKLIYTWAYVRFKYFNYTEELLYDNEDFNETLFLRGISESIMQDRDMKSKNSGVVFNFGLDIVRSLSLTKSMKLFDKLVKLLKAIQVTLKEDAPYFIWKTTTSPTTNNGVSSNILKVSF